MKEKLLDILGCPTCGGDILLAYASKYDDREIIEGVLTCKKCSREYKVVRGVPRFADLGKIEEDKAETADPHLDTSVIELAHGSEICLYERESILHRLAVSWLSRQF